MTRREFAKSYNACQRSLERFHQESLRTLNLLTLIGQFPESVEYRTTLELQRESEMAAQSEYHDRLNNLLTAVEKSARPRLWPAAARWMSVSDGVGPRGIIRKMGAAG